MGTTRPIRVYQWCNAGHYVEQSDAIRQEADSKLCCPIHLKPLALTEKKFLVPSEAYDRPRQPKLMPSAPVAVAVGVASTAVLPDNYERKGLVLINTSANIISLAFVYPAVLNSGITLNAAGGTYVMDEFTFSTGAVFAIAAAGASNLAVQEYT
jgi:hypothetical protein